MEPGRTACRSRSAIFQFGCECQLSVMISLLTFDKPLLGHLPTTVRPNTRVFEFPYSDVWAFVSRSMMSTGAARPGPQVPISSPSCRFPDKCRLPTLQRWRDGLHRRQQQMPSSDPASLTRLRGIAVVSDPKEIVQQ